MIKFHKNHKLKIMQITDIQEVPRVSADTLQLLNAALETENPDLVVLTGDQIKGYGITYTGKGDELRANVAETIQKIMRPITDRNIPFAVTFGNHDRQVGLSNAEQLHSIYKQLPGCIYNEKDAYDAGTFHIPLTASDSEKTVFNLYLIDSGTDKKGGGYEAVSKEQLAWYRQTREGLRDADGYIPSMVFQHIPLCEFYELLQRVKRFTPKAIRAYRTHKNEFYTLNETSTGNFKEPPSVPDENAGEFDALCEKGDVLAVFVGHDHKNDFAGRYKDILLGFTPSAGFNEYGNGCNRGVRIIELDETDPKAFTTRVLTYRDLGFTRLEKPIKDFIYRHSPATVDAALVLAKYVLAAAALITAVIVLLTKLL